MNQFSTHVQTWVQDNFHMIKNDFYLILFLTFVCVREKKKERCMFRDMLVSSVLLGSLSYFLFWSQGLSHWTWTSLIWLGWLAHKTQGSFCLYFLSVLDHSQMLIHAAFYMSIRNLNLHFQACAASTLQNEASPQHLCFCADGTS